MPAQAAKNRKVLKDYSAAQLARMVGVSPGVVRRYALAGILGESAREGRFSFADLVLLRAIDSLRRARISSRRIRLALTELRAQLPPGVPISAAAVEAAGGRIVASYGDEVWDLENGQRVLDLVDPQQVFAVSESQFGPAEPEPTAERVEEWFELALAAEDEDPGQAAKLYRRILTLDRDHPDAHLNLGRLLHERGDLYLAERHYRRAIAVRDRDATAWFNLGVVLEDRRRKGAAVEAYRHAIALDDTHADAFYNLGNLLEAEGDSGEAVRCLKRYRELTH